MLGGPRQKLFTAITLALVFILSLWGIVPALAAGETAADQSASFQVRSVRERWVMTDGVRLPVSVYWPSTFNPFDRFPVVIFMHPWDCDKCLYEDMAKEYAGRGYVGLTYTTRGWFGAEGQIDCIDPECDLKDMSNIITMVSGDRRFPVLKDQKGPVVGVTGYSSGAIHAYLIAHRRNPRPGDPGDERVRAIAPMHGGTDLLFSLYPNGAVKWMWTAFLLMGGYMGNFCGMGINFLKVAMDPNLNGVQKLFAVIGALLQWKPLFNNVSPELVEMYKIATERRVDEQEKAKQFVRVRSARYWCDAEMDGTIEHPIDIPALITTGWKDDLFCPNEGLNAFSSLVDAPKRIIVENYGHAGGFSLPIPVQQEPVKAWIDAQVRDWFDHYLKGVRNGVEAQPRVSYYRDWDPARFGEAQTWPLPGTRDIPLYLGKSTGQRQGSLSLLQPGRSVPPDILYNKGMTGSLSLPYLNDLTGLFGGQPLNIPEKIKLFDMPMTGFSYVSSGLPADVTIAGAVRLVLSYECSEPFAQLAPRIYEVKPDGKEVFVCRGWYEGYNPNVGTRTSTESQPIEMAACCHRFSKGSRIKLELETADITMTWPYPKASTIKLYHDRSALSRVILPVVR